MDKIELKNISVLNNDDLILQNIDMSFSKGLVYGIMGNGGSGKTTIAKLLNGELKYAGEIKINGVEIVRSNFYLLKRFIMVVLNEEYKSSNKVVDELFSALNGMNLSNEDEKNRINKIVNYFEIGEYLESKINNLSIIEKSYIYVLKALVSNADYLVLDDMLINLTGEMQKKIVDYCKENSITLINCSSNMEDSLLSDYLYFLFKGKIAMEGKKKECYQEEKLIKRIGLNLPFMADLATQLKYYGLLDEIILDKKEMVDIIWK